MKSIVVCLLLIGLFVTPISVMSEVKGRTYEECRDDEKTANIWGGWGAALLFIGSVSGATQESANTSNTMWGPVVVAGAIMLGGTVSVSKWLFGQGDCSYALLLKKLDAEAKVLALTPSFAKGNATGEAAKGFTLNTSCNSKSEKCFNTKVRALASTLRRFVTFVQGIAGSPANSSIAIDDSDVDTVLGREYSEFPGNRRMVKKLFVLFGYNVI
jgi:hypothetical protein